MGCIHSAKELIDPIMAQTTSTTTTTTTTTSHTDEASSTSTDQTASKSINLLQLAAHCINATLLAAKPIQDYCTKSNSRTKSDGTLVTDADGAAQRIIYNEIRSLERTIRIVGEESDLEMENSGSCSGPGQGDANADADANADDVADAQQGKDEELFRQVEKDIEIRSVVCNDNIFIPPPPPLPNEDANTKESNNDEDHHAIKSSSSSLVNLKRVSVIVDPLDGTSSYAKGDYEAVTILVAIIVDNVPVFGVIVKPFGMGTNLHRFRDTDCSVVYGGTLVGGAFVMGGDELDRSRLYRMNKMGVESENMTETNTETETKTETETIDQKGHTRNEAVSVSVPVGEDHDANSEPQCKRQKKIEDIDNEQVDGGPSPTSVCTNVASTGKEAQDINAKTELSKRRAIISKSRAGGVVQKCIESLAGQNLIHKQPLFVTGAGYKTMKLVLGEENEVLWFFPKPGTSLWDVAAADALLRVMGGRISDKFGRDLNYGKGRLEADNVDGIIACCDSILHAKCLELYKSEKWED